MSTELTYLMDEICAGVEIYFTGRQGGQYWKTAFILCDDYIELTSKLYLSENTPDWSEKRRNKSFKTFPEILNEARESIAQTNAGLARTTAGIQERMKGRHKRRNDFFHSTGLLDLNVSARNCIDSFCDLFDYGSTLFAEDWAAAVRGTRNLETMEILLRIEKKAFSEPQVSTQLNDILSGWPRNKNTIRKKGDHIATHPEDLHLRLCVIVGGQDLREKLRKLL